MDAFYLSDYFHGYLEKLKISFKLKNVVILIASGVALSVASALLFQSLSAHIALPGPLAISILSLTIMSTVTMLIFDRREYAYGLLDKAVFLFKNKIHISGYIVISALVLISLFMCVFGQSFLVLAASLLFIFAPSIFSVFLSAVLNSLFKAVDRSIRIGSDYLDLLLFGVGALSFIISVLALIIGGAL